jgi:MoaA/NifB/PqqE/SkfB family radical SAM enzyme
MCDIWKGNPHVKKLEESDVRQLLDSLKKFGTRKIVLSGGEALLNPLFFRFCEMIRREKINIGLLSTGLTLKKHAADLVKWVDDIVVSLDGDEPVHNRIRNIPGAFQKLREGIAAMRSLDPGFRITGRSVIQRLNFRSWENIILAAREMGLDSISFLPADLSSEAFNRKEGWSAERKSEVLPEITDLLELRRSIENIQIRYKADFENGFIAESPQKFARIYDYYAACYGLCEFPYKKCNAPWVSTVIEADGSVRPCFFHAPFGNFRENHLEEIVNSPSAIGFRKHLDVSRDETCMKCVCSLYLNPVLTTIL